MEKAFKNLSKGTLCCCVWMGEFGYKKIIIIRMTITTIVNFKQGIKLPNNGPKILEPKVYGLINLNHLLDSQLL